ncbi:MAG: hypothetical protein A2096_03245 [Spirochaetes bacterium GWF1_41_5]|nr:MAG: hypothetical protein A2096_03245 [Spirochaetes bacterium GWF1_41_5]
MTNFILFGGMIFFLGYASIPISNDFVRFVSDKTDKIWLLGIPSRTCPELTKGKIIALRYIFNLQKMLDNMGHSLFFTFRENLFLAFYQKYTLLFYLPKK